MVGNMERGASDLDGRDDSSSYAEGGSTRSVSPDEILSAVANEYRRAVLATLDHTLNRTIGFDKLVERVTDRVRDDALERPAGEHHQRVRIALHHVHLPKLEAVRIVDYEVESGNVRYVGTGLELELQALVDSYDARE
jgi:hypothetical protein